MVYSAYVRQGTSLTHGLPYHCYEATGLLPDTQNCGLRMRWECQECFPHHRFQRKPLGSDPVMHHGTCVTHVSWCMLGSLTHSGRENVPGISGACATGNFTYLVRSPWCQPVKSHAAYMWCCMGSSLVQVIACHMFNHLLLVVICNSMEKHQSNLKQIIKLWLENMPCKCCLQNVFSF